MQRTKIDWTLGSETMTRRSVMFTGPMVVKIQTGMKTQTRRVVSRTNTDVDGYGRKSAAWWAKLHLEEAAIDVGPSPGGHAGPYLKVPREDLTVHRLYPIYAPGDVLYVCEGLRRSESGMVVYAADGTPAMPDGESRQWQWKNATLPSTYMPRWACRLFVRVAEVRVQRIASIQQNDAVAEGVSSVEAFECLWNSINSKRSFSWASDPWVWIVDFRRM